MQIDGNQDDQGFRRELSSLEGDENLENSTASNGNRYAYNNVTWVSNNAVRQLLTHSFAGPLKSFQEQMTHLASNVLILFLDLDNHYCILKNEEKLFD